MFWYRNFSSYCRKWRFSRYGCCYGRWYGTSSSCFVATLLFKDKFTKEERESGLTNIVMGLSFITEGAIPFGAADPARAIPSFIAGSALTGALVGLAGIKLMAPHGGIFVIALTSNPILYLVFVVIGALVSGILFGALRKKSLKGKELFSY